MTLDPSLTAAQVIIRTLKNAGVDTMFGIPGVHTLALYDALNTDPGIRHILARHEQGAGFMADGYARASGRTGVALVITGPGVTNIATAVGQAYTDSSPVLVLATNVERPYLDAMRGSLHDLRDQPALMTTITKSATRLLDAGRAAEAVSIALNLTASGRPQPVHLEIPKDVLDEPAPFQFPIPGSDASPEIDQVALSHAATMIATAKRPLIYAGGGVISSNSAPCVKLLAERLRAPVLTSLQGKGSIPEDHSLSLGTLWTTGNRIDDLAHQADCLLVIGSKLGVQSTEHFTFPTPEHLIRIEIDSAEMTRNASPLIELHGDAARILPLLLSAIPSSASTWNIETICHAREQARRGAFGTDRQEWIAAIRAAMPRHGIVTWDMTMMSYVAGGLYPVYEPRTWMFPHGFGTLGFAFPAAIGAAIAKPDTPVACVVGDGGFQFTMQELATAITCGIGLPIILFNDSTYSAVKDEQHRTRGGRTMAVDLGNPDFVKIAEAYGIPGVRVTSPDHLTTEIAHALDRKLPTILDVPIPGWV